MAALADVGLPAVGQLLDEAERLGYASRLDDRCLIGVRIAIAHVVANRAREERRGLAHQRY